MCPSSGLVGILLEGYVLTKGAQIFAGVLESPGIGQHDLSTFRQQLATEIQTVA